ncbi:hypothetical protein KUTeg_000191 [Tegillarca granosa]|uniref:SERRATE/Ars2 C-terminal domain-containing protein n=1 Tax=Tegillarca granosa TaxID=220873 RepID=A0ABQ9G182_TEGGR|nr:hypothetical protein KUTeg_000191 [Tegillarca granosa]
MYLFLMIITEVEKFVTANTQELAKDKWLCPLSGKKFKGPEFVRKHIFNKHGEKVDEVRLEVAFFNNYLLDPKRPQLPEHPGNKQGSQGASGGQPQYANQGGYQGHPQSMMGYNQPRPPMMYGGQQYQHPGYMSRDSYSRNDGYKRAYTRPYRSRHSDPRSVIEYRDLDAPDEADIF